MNSNENNPIIISQHDFDLLRPYFSKPKNSEEMSLSAELSRAVIIKDDAFPSHAIRLNSKVWIQEESTEKVTELTIVLPQYANIKEKKISIITPIAAALIGFRKGETVRWEVPAGIKVFTIIDVLAPVQFNFMKPFKETIRMIFEYPASDILSGALITY